MIRDSGYNAENGSICKNAIFGYKRMYMCTKICSRYWHLTTYSTLYPDYGNNCKNNFVGSKRMKVFWQICRPTKLQHDTYHRYTYTACPRPHEYHNSYISIVCNLFRKGFIFCINNRTGGHTTTAVTLSPAAYTTHLVAANAHHNQRRQVRNLGRNRPGQLYRPHRGIETGTGNQHMHVVETVW